MNYLSPHPIVCENELSQRDLFLGVEDSLILSLSREARNLEVPKGEVMIHQGEPFRHFYIICHGWLGLSKTNEGGHESLLQLFSDHDVLPDLDHRSISKAPFQVASLVATKLIALPFDLMRESIRKSDQLTKNYHMKIEDHASQLRSHIEQLTLHTAEERVGHFFLQLKAQAKQNGTEINLPFDKATIANYLGIKPETFSRVLTHFKERGYVIDRNQITIPGAASLCVYCNSLIAHVCPRGAENTCLNPEQAET